MQNIAELKTFFIQISPGLSEAAARSLARAYGVREKWPHQSVRK